MRVVKLKRLCVRLSTRRLGGHISKIDKEILTCTYRKDGDDTDKPTMLELDTIISADDDVSR